ncbi:MAG: TolC family protein [Phycisphaerales bacterium]|nr:TolC family protein [Phycisphaerales bacterium]
MIDRFRRANPQCPRPWALSVCMGGAAALLLAAGCASPLSEPSDATQRALVDGLMRELREARDSDAGVQPLTRSPLEIDIDNRFMDDVQSIAGIRSYTDVPDEFGVDLLGNSQATRPIDLQTVIRAAVEHNYALQFARLDPVVAEAGVVRAEAAFDWVLFADATYTNSETEQISTSAFTPARDEREVTDASLGLRRLTPLGGTLSIEQQFSYSDIGTEEVGGIDFTPNPAWQSTLTVRAQQPLLRGFGTDVAREGLLLARNDERDSLANLKASAINTVLETETAYWELYRARQNLKIVQRLLDRGVETQRQIRIRQEVDADPAEVADADARVQERRQTVIQQQTTVRDQNDRLKVAMSDPRYPVAGELLLLPADAPVDQAIEYGLFDAYQSALRRRPEIFQALLSLDNTAIRRRVAENGLLPQLDLTAQLSVNDLDEDFDDVWSDTYGFSRQSWLLGLEFELPIGNRAAEATRNERRVQQYQATIAYQNTVQGVIAEVRTSLRRAREAYERIGQAASNRLAAANRLRVLDIQRETIAVNTPERLNLEFQAQERLAAAEQAEVGALVDYMIGIANLHAAMGTALERNGIRFVVPGSGPLEDPYEDDHFGGAQDWSNYDASGIEPADPDESK